MALSIVLLCLSIWFIYWTFLLLGVGLACTRYHLFKVPEVSEKSLVLPPVTILKPLCGWDGGLKENLETFFQLDYPQFQIIFCLVEPDKTIYSIVESLMKRYPQVDVQINVSIGQRARNPKINNLQAAFQAGKFDVMLISDSNVRVERDYLKQMVVMLRGKVGVVTSPVKGIGQKFAGGHLESIYLDTYLKRWIYISNRLGKPIVLGKSMLFRRSVLNQLGGIEHLKDMVAEDYATSRLMCDGGFQVAILKTPVQQYLGDFNLRSFWARHVRWGRIRKSCEWKAFLMEPLSNALISGLLGAFAWRWFLGGQGVLVFLSLHLIVSAMAELKVSEHSRRFSDRIFFFGSWLFLELITLPLWIHSLCGRTVLWRGNRLRLYPGGRLRRN